jgi:hypothetical protein
MKKLFWISSAVLFTACLVILAIALTNNSPSNPFINYRITIGLVFLLLVAAFRIIYRYLYK